MQTFLRGHRVKVADDLGYSMSHFSGAGHEAIIEGSYGDLCGMYGPRANHKFSLVLLRDGAPFNKSAWYDESQLTLLSADRDAGEQIIQDYKKR